MDTNTAHAIAGTAIVLVGAMIYFAPTITAWPKRNWAAVLALNVLLGWTVLGWVGALVWSLVEDKD